MKNLLIIYAVIQLVSTAYGIAVIETVKPIIKPKGEYDSENKGSLYNFSTTIKDILKGFIPFYYFSKALALVAHSRSMKYKNQEIIESEDEKEDEDLIIYEEPKTDNSLFMGYRILDEKPEKYVARKNDISVYDEEETPIEYITRQNLNKVQEEEKDLELTPFLGGSNIVEHVVLKDEVSGTKLAKAIAELSPEDSKLLREKLLYLEELKERTKSLRLEKDKAA